MNARRDLLRRSRDWDLLEWIVELDSRYFVHAVIFLHSTDADTGYNLEFASLGYVDFAPAVEAAKY